MAIIRQEYGDDYEAIREIYEEAFNQPDEADLIEALRKGDQVVVSLVAEENRELTGHIMFSKVTIEESDIKVVGLGPMAVLPEFQGQGIGTLLVGDGLDECLSLGYDAVIVLGHPDFYPRFGFKPASEFGIRPQWDGVPDDAFMVLELHTGVLDEVEGMARYAEEFDAVA